MPRVTQLLNQMLTASHGDLGRRRQLLLSRLAGGGTPLHAAAAMGHVEVVRLLLEAGADPNAAAEGSGCAVERLVKEKQEPSPPFPFEVPDGWVLTPIEPVEEDDWYEEETPLHAACAGCVCVGVDSAVDPSVLVHARASWGPGDEGIGR